MAAIVILGYELFITYYVGNKGLVTNSILFC